MDDTDVAGGAVVTGIQVVSNGIAVIDVSGTGKCETVS